MSRSRPRARSEHAEPPRGQVRVARAAQLLGVAVLLAATAALVAAVLGAGPTWLAGAGSVGVVTVYAAALAGRTGGRPLVFGALALGLAVAALVVGGPQLRTGAAVMTAVSAAVLGVMLTVPAERFTQAVRECALACLIAVVGALAAIGFEPVVNVLAFEYVVAGGGLLLTLVLVQRLGTGFHGLGRRGLVILVVGGLLLAGALLYGELLRRYGTPDIVASLLDGVRWTRENLGAFPRPVMAFIGIPALAYGCHLRARRRQGWWVCAFGVAATAGVATSLVNPVTTLREGGLATLYGLLLGLVIALGVIRLDQRVTGTSRSSRGRRARGGTEDGVPLRPEPRRSQALW